MRRLALAVAVLALLVTAGCAAPATAPQQQTQASSQPGPQSAPRRPAPSAQIATTPSNPSFDPSQIPSMPPPGAWAATITNPWFPLRPGSARVYTGLKDGRHTIETFVVTPRKKMILGVSATVVHDTLRSTKRGRLIEDTFDWYAQDASGNVWYLGENTKTFKADGHSVESTEGSWQAGVNGAKAGVFMPAVPTVGFRQFQEYYPGQAEDRFEIMSLDTSVTVPYAAFPRSVMLAEETSALEPGAVSHKYYVRGIGEVYEVDVQGGNEYDKLMSVTR